MYRSVSIIWDSVFGTNKLTAPVLKNNYSRFCSSLTTVPMAADVYEPDKSKQRPPILILHGLLGSKTNWKSLAKVISTQSGRTVYCLDARNHGESPHIDRHDYFAMSADVEHFMESHEIKSCVLLGHSMGGRTAMVTALQKPYLVESLVVVDISPSNPKKGDFKSQSSDILGLIEAMKESTKEISPGMGLAEVRRAVDKSMSKTVTDVGLRQFLLTNLREENDAQGEISWRVNLDILERSIISGNVHFPTTLEGIVYAGPTLFICGGKSNYLRPEKHGRVKTFFPNCRIEYVMDAGHWVHAEKPAEFLKILMPFLM